MKKSFDAELYIRHSNEIEDVDESKAVLKSKIAWEYLRSQDALTHEAIKTTHRLIMEDRKPELAGKYRDAPVVVGTHKPEEESRKDVESSMDSLLGQGSDPETLEEIKQFHIEFETIHPFLDGNGRVGRMIMWKQCLENKIDPPLYTRENRQEYYRMFRKARL